MVRRPNPSMRQTLHPPGHSLSSTRHKLSWFVWIRLWDERSIVKNQKDYFKMIILVYPWDVGAKTLIRWRTVVHIDRWTVRGRSSLSVEAWPRYCLIDLNFLPQNPTITMAQLWRFKLALSRFLISKSLMIFHKGSANICTVQPTTWSLKVIILFSIVLFSKSRLNFESRNHSKMDRLFKSGSERFVTKRI